MNTNVVRFKYSIKKTTTLEKLQEQNDDVTKVKAVQERMDVALKAQSDLVNDKI